MDLLWLLECGVNKNSVDTTLNEITCSLNMLGRLIINMLRLTSRCQMLISGQPALGRPYYNTGLTILP